MEDKLTVVSLSASSLSGCPRARKGSLKLTPNKDEKDDQEIKYDFLFLLLSLR